MPFNAHNVMGLESEEEAYDLMLDALIVSLAEALKEDDFKKAEPALVSISEVIDNLPAERAQGLLVSACLRLLKFPPKKVLVTDKATWQSASEKAEAWVAAGKPNLH